MDVECTYTMESISSHFDCVINCPMLSGLVVIWLSVCVSNASRTNF